jgi:hypothetical protein
MAITRRTTRTVRVKGVPVRVTTTVTTTQKRIRLK